MYKRKTNNYSLSFEERMWKLFPYIFWSMFLFNIFMFLVIFVLMIFYPEVVGNYYKTLLAPVITEIKK